MKKGESSISLVQENRVLKKIDEIANSEINRDRILAEVVKIIGDASRGDSVFVYLFDKGKRRLVLMASKTQHTEEIGKIQLDIGEGITGWVAGTSTPVVISAEAYRDKRFKSFDALPEDKYESFLSVPIVNKRECVGVINVQHKKPHEYGDEAVNLVSFIAKQIGGLIENACLYEEAKKKAIQFDSLARVSKSIVSRQYLDEILSLIVVVTAEMLNSSICSVMLLDAGGRELVMKATQSLSKEYVSKPNLKVNDSLSGDVIKTKKPAAIYDVREERKYRFRDLAVKENLTSMLCVPMVMKDKAVGLINVYTKEPHVFTEEEINVLQMIANQAAVTVENTKLIEEILKVKEALETRKIIERAKSILMRVSNLDDETAYSLIHKKSMDSRRSMKDIAESILLVNDLKEGTKAK